MQLDTTKLNVIGYDRIKIYTHLVSVNTNKNYNDYGHATKRANVKYKVFDTAVNDYIYLNSFEFKRSITGENITTSEKDCIVFGLHLNRERNVIVLDVVLPRIAYGTIHNIYNVSKKEEAIKTMNMLKETLKAEGIELSPIETWEVFSLEMNKTIKADKPLHHFRENLNWLFNNAFKEEIIAENGDHRKRLSDNSVSNTLRFSTKRIKKKMYDKSCQLKDTLNFFIDENLIRLELTYDKEAIKRAFISNKFLDVFNEERMNRSYNKATIQLIELLNKFTEAEINKLETEFTCANLTEIKKVYDENAKKMFDILFLIEATKRVYKREKNNKFNRDIKKLLKSYDKALYNNYNELRKILIAFNNNVEAINFDEFNKFFK